MTPSSPTGPSSDLGGAAAPDHAVRNRPRRSRNAGNTAMTNASSAALDPKLLEILVCPLTRGPLIYDRERNELISKQAGLAYSIRDGIPVMLPDAARPLGDGEA